MMQLSEVQLRSMIRQTIVEANDEDVPETEFAVTEKGQKVLGVFLIALSLPLAKFGFIGVWLAKLLGMGANFGLEKLVAKYIEKKVTLEGLAHGIEGMTTKMLKLAPRSGIAQLANRVATMAPKLLEKYPNDPDKLAAIYATDALLKVIQVGVTTKTVGVPKAGKGKAKKVKIPTGFDKEGFIKLDHSKLPEDYQILYGPMDKEPDVQKLIDTVKAEESRFVAPIDPAQAALPFSTDAEEHNRRLASGEFDTEIARTRSIPEEPPGEQMDLFKDPIKGDPFRKVPGRTYSADTVRPGPDITKYPSLPKADKEEDPDFENMTPEEFDEWLSSQPRAKKEDFTESVRSIDEIVDSIARMNEVKFR